jgi:hypothetical protein
MKVKHKLLDAICESLDIKNDAALARFLECLPSLICKIRNQKTSVSPWFILRVYDKTGWTIEAIRALMIKEKK